MSVEIGPSPRPVLHFTPREGWMNDPNGMFYRDGVWHLFYQHNPYDSQWGDIHWGHATSRDLVRWEVLGPALAPSALGVVASGCVVVDHDNRSGLSENGATPIVALFTHMPPEGRQVQSLAVSLDGAASFEEWPDNPILVDDREKDFRDPKVVWVPAMDAWVMALAVGERVRLYRSSDLRQWALVQTFGEHRGAHGGVWECPDLFPLSDPDGTERWVLLVSIQDNAPNRGSGMQYFIGQMTGDGFVADDDDPAPRWLDHGPDCYAGVTFFDAPEARRVMVAWMSNWRYAADPPTSPWRGSMTLPRELVLQRIHGRIELVQRVPSEITALRQAPGQRVEGRFAGRAPLVRTAGVDDIELGLEIPLGSGEVRITGLTEAGQALELVVDRDAQTLRIERAQLVPPHSRLAEPATLPLEFDDDRIELRLIVDLASVEVFVDGGRRVATAQIHPRAPLTEWRIEGRDVGVRARHWRLAAGGASHGPD